MTKVPLLEKFPKSLPAPNASQISVLSMISKALAHNYRFIIVEAPVGSGKSGMAVACANHFGNAHVLTPQKSLQNQYFDDFSSEGLVLMKGRRAYPCTYQQDDAIYNEVLRQIEDGNITQPEEEYASCAKGPCLSSSRIKKACAEEQECPYHVAIAVANESKTVVHNLHSFIFQAYYFGRFQRRDLLIIDESHRAKHIIRDFADKKIRIPTLIDEETLYETDDFESLLEWADWLEQFADKFPSIAAREKASPREVFLETLEVLRDMSPKFGPLFVSDISEDDSSTVVRFIPEKIGDLCNQFLFNYGNKVIMFSGTVYDKVSYCRELGINVEDACFIRIPSTFPANMRPIYCKPEYMVDTSYANFEENYPILLEKIKDVFSKFKDCKGLIHAPSYEVAERLIKDLENTERVMGHSRHNLQVKLTEFFELTDSNKVFISPSCTEGVDFKGDRGRFQLILRVPYPNASDVFVKHMVAKNFAWYNLESLITFGQMTGRINRGPTDFGATILMDERFPRYIAKNSRLLPKWFTDAIIYK